MKILHTSDWHLGQSFMGKSRRQEHEAFLKWLRNLIVEEAVDLLLVSGDIFDTGTPPNYALESYYNFIRSLSNTSCQRIIITAGNHDSVATLKAPQKLLRSFGVEVVTGEEEHMPLFFHEEKGEISAIVCAIPFLREGFVRKSCSGEGAKEKEKFLQEGIQAYFRDIAAEAEKVRGKKDIPIIGMGHLTTLGGSSSESEREIYVGGSLHMNASFFASLFDYTALGHLHKNQRMGEGVYYSGSPIALSFSEAGDRKRVNIVTFEGRKADVKRVDIPLFRKLIRCKGDIKKVLETLRRIDDKESWIEVEIDDSNPYEANLRIREAAQELGLTLLVVKLQKNETALRQDAFDVISLDELTPAEVFQKRLEADSIDDEGLKKALLELFETIVDEVSANEDS